MLHPEIISRSFARRLRPLASALSFSALFLLATAFSPGAAQAQPMSPQPMSPGMTPDGKNPDFSPAAWQAAQSTGDSRGAAESFSQLAFGPPVVETWQRYNDVQQKSAHNSYTRDEAILDQLIYHRIRSLELDIHNGKTGWSATSQNWYVYHADIWEPGTTCHRLSDCLNELRAFHVANPQHEVVTVFIDLKDYWEDGRKPWDLDARLLANLPSSWILKPADLMAACPGATTLQSAVRGSCDWPYLSSLRGKFIFALTGGDVEASGTALNAYVADGAEAKNRVAFIAPDLTSNAQILAKDYVVFFNINTGNKYLAGDVFGNGFVSRVWGLNDTSDFNAARGLFAHHLGTDMVNYNQDPGVTTHNYLGWPFSCIFSCATTAESSRILGVDVDSDDIWGSKDNFRFLYEVNTSTTDAYWRAAVSSPNSHVEPWAKGCLMARGTTANNSPYFAICRPADENKLRIQWRTSTGGGSSEQSVDIVPGDTIDQESLSFIELLVYSSGKCAAGYGSQDGSSWVLIGYKCFSTPLQRQGLATSSHGGGTVRFLYTNVTKNGSAYYNESFPNALSIGTVRGYWAYNGTNPY